MTDPEIIVRFDFGGDPDEVAEAQAAFAEAGISAEVSDQPGAMVASGGPDLPEVSFVVVTLFKVTTEHALGTLLTLKTLPPWPSGTLEYDLDAGRWRDAGGR